MPHSALPTCPRLPQPRRPGLGSCDGCSKEPSEHSASSRRQLLPALAALPAVTLRFVALRADFQLHIRNGELMSFPWLPVHPLHEKGKHQEEATPARLVEGEAGGCAGCRWDKGPSAGQTRPGGLRTTLVQDHGGEAGRWGRVLQGKRGVKLAWPHSYPSPKLQVQNKHINWPIV